MDTTKTAAGDTLLRLRTPLSQADPHLDKQSAVGASGGYRDRTMRKKMPSRRVERGRQVEAYLRNSEGERARDTRQRQAGMEEHGATEAAQGAMARSGGSNDDSKRQENASLTINGKEGGMRPD